MKAPAFLLYAGDWLSDEKLRACSFAARGLWIDMLCLMHKNDRRGHLLVNGQPASLEQICRLTGSVSTDEVSRLLAELKSAGVTSALDNGGIYSSRMVRDERIKTQTRNRVSKHRKGCVTHDVTHSVTDVKRRCTEDEDEDEKQGNGNAKGKGFGGGDDPLDEKIRAYFANHPALIWSPVDHEAYRKLVLCSSWETAAECVKKAVVARAGRPVQYALGILNNLQLTELKKPKVSPPGKWADKPYAGG